MLTLSLMSKGFGSTQQSILHYFRYRPYAALTLGRLCEEIYYGASRSRRVAVIRAIKRLTESGRPIGWLTANRPGGELILVGTDNELGCRGAKALAHPEDSLDRCTTAITGQPSRASRLPGREARGQRALCGVAASAYRFLLAQGNTPAEITVERLTEF